MNPSPEPVIVDCPAGYQCQLMMSAVWSAEVTAAIIVGVVAIIVVGILLYAWISRRDKDDA